MEKRDGDMCRGMKEEYGNECEEGDAESGRAGGGREEVVEEREKGGGERKAGRKRVRIGKSKEEKRWERSE